MKRREFMTLLRRPPLISAIPPMPIPRRLASLSSCHMLTLLAIACKQRFVLDSYDDEAVGHMEKNADGKMAITRVELRQSPAP
jgi:hypothetical protein